MKKDISTPQDVQHLVNSFYAKVKGDPVIGYIFSDIMQVNWEQHLPVMYSFWETILLDKNTYKGNPVLKHLHVHEKEPLTEEHFERWLALWTETVDEIFEGAKADEAKFKANTIRQLMLTKIKQSRTL